MKRKLIFITVGTGGAIILALILSTLGHFKIWIFTDSFNDNLFITGGLAFITGLLTQNNTSQFAKGMSVLYTGRNEKPEQHPGNEQSRFGTLLYLSIIFVIICLLSFLLPDLRL
ncbi:MAG: hypothetical protein JEZ04_21700 [Spirochaetales bacterium]|nr:hypothetical protein [Spirochaetales bacterium]